MLINFTSVTNSVFRGFKQFMGDYYEVLMKLGNASILFFMLYILYKKG